MIDDIVTRLREVAVQEYKDGWAVFPICNRAADEIERLRAESDHYKRIAEEAISNLEQAVKLLQAFQAAVRD